MTRRAVTVAGQPATKPAHPVGAATTIAVTAEGPRWVGRAAHKLVAALDDWAADGLA